MALPELVSKMLPEHGVACACALQAGRFVHTGVLSICSLVKKTYVMQKARFVDRCLRGLRENARFDEVVFKFTMYKAFLDETMKL